MSRPKLTFFQEDMQKTKRHKKRWSTLLITRDTQIKTTMKYQLTPI